MATYSVVCSNVGSFTFGNRFTLYVVLNDRDGNPWTNRSAIDYNVYFQNTSNGGTFKSQTRLYFSLNGIVIRDETLTVTGPRNGTVTIASGSLPDVEHNPDGSKGVSFQALVQSTNLGISGNIQDTFWLNTIPRYSEINGFSVQSTGVNTATLQYSVSRTANIYCSVDGHDWGNPQVYNTTSGTFTIGGLTPGVQHSFAILVRAVDSGLDRISNTIYTTTIDYAKIRSANDFNIGEVPSMTYTATPPGCSIKAYLERITGNGGSRIDSISETKEVTGTSCTFDYDKDWLYSKLPDANSAWCRYCLITTCNGTEYLHFIDRQYFVTNSNPIFSNFSYRDSNEEIVNNLTGNNQTIIKGFSNVEATISVANKATAINGASMKEYRLSIGEKSKKESYSNAEDVSITINSALSDKFTVYAVDSRENSTSKSIIATNYIEYQNIAIKTITATRKNSVLAETTLNFTGYIWDGNFGLVNNEITECYYRYRKTTEQEWTVGTTKIVPIKNGTDFSFNSIIIGDLGAEGFDIDESFEIQIFVADKLSNNYSNPASFTLGPGTPALAVYKNNIAINGRYDVNNPNKCQVYGDTYFGGNLSGPALTETPIGTVFEFVGDVLPNTYLWCNGEEISRTEYSDLFEVIGTTYGSGDGSTTFNLPDYRGRVPVGKNENDIDFDVVGKLGGHKDQDLRALIGATNNDSTRIGYVAVGAVSGKGYSYSVAGNSSTSNIPSSQINHSTPVFRSDGNYASTIQPYFVTNYIIKATNTINVLSIDTARVIDNLESSNSGDALSANQGKILNEKIGGIVLYNNLSGTTGTVTLNQSVNNFNCLEIFFKYDSLYGSARVDNPNGKQVSLSVSFSVPQYNVARTQYKTVNISSTSITNNQYGYLSASTTNSLGVSVTENSIHIIKVLGYK